MCMYVCVPEFLVSFIVYIITYVPNRRRASIIKRYHQSRKSRCTCTEIMTFAPNELHFLSKFLSSSLHVSTRLMYQCKAFQYKFNYA